MLYVCGLENKSLNITHTWSWNLVRIKYTSASHGRHFLIRHLICLGFYPLKLWIFIDYTGSNTFVCLCVCACTCMHVCVCVYVCILHLTSCGYKDNIIMHIIALKVSHRKIVVRTVCFKNDQVEHGNVFILMIILITIMWTFVAPNL